MINNLINLMPQIDKIKIHDLFPKIKNDYAVATVHRNVNVDQPQKLRQVVDILANISKHIQIVFPVHPRTKNNLVKYGLMSSLKSNKNILIIDPLDYLVFIALVKSSKLVITDSGGIQAETTYLKIPTITLRKNTEWTETVKIGSNVLCDLNEEEKIFNIVARVLAGNFKKCEIPEKWDGKVAERILNILVKNNK